MQDPSKRHELDRTSVRELLCALCELRQPVAAACSGCGVSFGAYACLACCFFDDDLKVQSKPLSSWHCSLMPDRLREFSQHESSARIQSAY